MKGMGIGTGAFIGHALLGPYGAIGGAFLGWLAGNKAAIKAEKQYTDSQLQLPGKGGT